MTEFPDGIADPHVGGQTSRWPYTHWIALLLLGTLMALAVSGALGGGKNDVLTAQGSAAALRIDTPQILRSGEFFEVHIDVDARQPIAEPTIAIATPYWRNMTINTMVPAPVEESGTEGAFTFSYDALEAGDHLRLKFDGQVNPTLRGGNRGWIELRDGETPLLRIPLRLKVLP